MPPSIAWERRFWAEGLSLVAGLDEVGRGAWAGPVVAGAVILPPEPPLCSLLRSAGLRDSKLLSAAQRDGLVPLIRALSLGAGVGVASAAEIDELGIVSACRLAMRRALDALPASPDALLLDAFPLPDDERPQQAIVRGDDISLSIAAGAVLAKVWRDGWMVDAGTAFPAYGFARNKGYGTPAHRAALAEHGPSPIHRRSWRPMRDLHITQRPFPDVPSA